MLFTYFEKKGVKQTLYTDIVFTCPVKHMCTLNIKWGNSLINEKENCF